MESKVTLLSKPIKSGIPSWKLPPGVCRGTWDYLQSEDIARDYDRKLAESALLKLDERFILDHLPTVATSRSTSDAPRVGDFGCGTGRISRLLSPMGFRMLNVDLSPVMLQVLQEKCSHPQSNECVQSNLVELDFLQPQSLDAAVCLFSSIGMIHGRENRQKFLRYVCNGLKPLSPLILHVHNRYHSLWHPTGPTWLVSTWLKSKLTSTWEFGDRVFPDLGIPSMFLHIYSRRELIQDLKIAGFESVSIFPINVPGDQLIASGVLSSFRAGGYFAVAKPAK